MKTISKNKYIILSSSCKVVEGKYRGVIIDYLRRNLYYISKEYCSFLININRKSIMDIEKQLEDASSLEMTQEEKENVAKMLKALNL